VNVAKAEKIFKIRYG